MKYDIVVVGGGIAGLATAFAITDNAPGLRVALLEKEPGWARHQTGRNSGVIHSGIYYRPGSLKAKMAVRGGQEIIDFCRHHDLPYVRNGKIIVATDEAEARHLQALRERGEANGLTVRWLSSTEIREREPYVRGVRGLHVPATGICDFGAVAAKLAELLAERNVVLCPSTTVTGFVRRNGEVVVETDRDPVVTRRVVNCCGLYSDEIARLSGHRPPVRITPFRGEYYALTAERDHLVNDLVYPVPDPAFPFLGIHLTRMIRGGVHVGPNAVLALSREGYRKSAWDRAGVRDLLSNRGLRPLARSYWRYGAMEWARSLSKTLFVRSVQRLVPDITKRDLIAAPAGVRAQAIQPDGTLVDDFVIAEDGNYVHLLNAPSPAATAAFPIGREMARRCLAGLD